MSHRPADMGYPQSEALVWAMRSRSFGHAAAWAELIDNAIGNGAHNVRIGQRKDIFSIVDDGTGCTAEMFGALQTIGKHQENPTIENPTSMFGVGASDAVLFLGGLVEYASLRDGQAFYSKVDWDKMATRYAPPQTIDGPNAVTAAKRLAIQNHGVAILVSRVNRRLHFESVKRKLEELFWPAAEQGKLITLFRDTIETTIARKEMPAFIKDRRLDRDLVLPSGKSIHVYGGIMDPSVRGVGGYEYVLGHRVLMPPCGHGASDYAYDRVYFRVRLLGQKNDWALERNKAGLMDEDLQDLESAVFIATQHLLCDEQAQILQMPGPEDDIDTLLNEYINPPKRGKAKRPNDGVERGTIKPRHTRRKVKEAAIVDELEEDDVRERDAREKRACTDIKVKRTTFGDDERWKMARVDVASRWVYLNDGNTVIAKYIADKNLPALAAIIAAQWCMKSSLETDTGQKLMQVRDTAFEDYQRRMDQMLGKAERCQLQKSL